MEKCLASGSHVFAVRASSQKSFLGLTAVSCRGSGSGGVAGSLHSQVTCHQLVFGLTLQLRVVWTYTSPSSARVQNNNNNDNARNTDGNQWRKMEGQDGVIL